jgi:hypothetical protein
VRIDQGIAERLRAMGWPRWVAPDWPLAGTDSASLAASTGIQQHAYGLCRPRSDQELS